MFDRHKLRELAHEYAIASYRHDYTMSDNAELRAQMRLAMGDIMWHIDHAHTDDLVHLMQLVVDAMDEAIDVCHDGKVTA
jgi:hypothetical protein